MDMRVETWNVLESWDGVMWIGLVGLEIETGGELL
jgi:hypothetical protein